MIELPAHFVTKLSEHFVTKLAKHFVTKLAKHFNHQNLAGKQAIQQTNQSQNQSVNNIQKPTRFMRTTPNHSDDVLVSPQLGHQQNLLHEFSLILGSETF